MEAVMNDQRKTKAQLIAELELTRTRVAELVPKQADEGLHDIIEIIQFTEHVSAKIHGLLSKTEIYRTVKEEFTQSKQYSASILLLTDDDSSLRIAEASLSPAKVKAGEKATGLRTKGYKIDLKKSSIYRKVVIEGKTVQVSASDIMGELFPRPLARLVLKALGFANKSSILTPLKRHGKIIGAFAMTAPELAEYFIPSVKNLAQHISNALEWADEYSEHKRAEEELRESEDKYRTIFENVSDSITYIDKYGTIISANDKEEIFGRKPEEIIGKRFTELGYFDVKDIPKYLKLLKEVITGKKTPMQMELEVKHKDGHKFPVEMSTSLVKKNGKTVGFVCITRNITERKRAEEELRESEEKYRLLAENANDSIYVLSSQGFEYVNPTFLRTCGYDTEELIGGHFDYMRLVHPEDRPVIEEWQITRDEGREVPSTYEFRLVRKDGEIRNLEVNTVVLPGEPWRVMGIYRDITERKRVEEELRESEERFRVITETATDAIVTIDENMEIVFANYAVADIFGYRVEEILGHSLAILMPEDLGENLSLAIKKYLKTEKKSISWKNKRFPGQKKDGQIIPLEFSFNEFVKDGHHFFTGMIRDVTDRQRLEAEMLRSAKLESLGVMAGGLAHDFNNFLSSIMLNVGTAKLKAGKGKETRDLLQAAEQSIQKAKGITQQLLTFTRGGEPVKSSMSLQPMIEESAKFTLHGSNVIPRFDLPDDLWPAEVDPGQINQVINSLTLNAVQAMPRGGHLTVRGRNVTIKKGDPRTILAPGNYVEVALKDDGVGIPPESLDSIFDPYYTTREEGTGLGLFSVFSIIERHGGWITVESEVDRGTTFTFYLPAADEEEVAVTSSDIMKGSGRVLIMDDDETICLGMTALLGELGYEVETTANGEEAIERYGEALKSDRPFDVVILDLTVPGGMGGAEAIGRLRELDPRVNAIVSSGYSTDPIMANHQKYGFKAVLPKPFQPAELSRAMNQVFG